jgi:hypothetical protein
MLIADVVHRFNGLTTFTAAFSIINLGLKAYFEQKALTFGPIWFDQRGCASYMVGILPSTVHLGGVAAGCDPSGRGKLWK